MIPELWITVLWGRTQFKCHFHHRISNILSTWFIYVDVDLIEVVFIGSLHCKLSHLLPFPYFTLWKDITICSPHLRSEALCSLLKCRASTEIIWNFSAWEICFFSPSINLFGYLLISLWTMKINFILWFIIQCHLFCCSNCSNFSH